MALYPSLQQLSSKLIREFGLPCMVKCLSEGRYNPSTGEHKAQEMTHQAHCLFDNLAYDFSSFRSDSSRGSSVMVKQGDVLIYVTAQGKPEINAKIITERETWVVINCQPIKPANGILLYQCQARRAE